MTAPSPMAEAQAALAAPPWYRQFWPWFLIALPASSVVACFFLLYLAIANRDALVTDDYYKVGITINTALAEMDNAHSLGITAAFAPIQNHKVVLLFSANAQLESHNLQLKFRHPTLAEEDFTVELTAQADSLGQDFSKRYEGEITRSVSGRWMVSLSPTADAPMTDSPTEDTQARWRLEGVWRAPQQQPLQLGVIGTTE